MALDDMLDDCEAQSGAAGLAAAARIGAIEAPCQVRQVLRLDPTDARARAALAELAP